MSHSTNSGFKVRGSREDLGPASAVAWSGRPGPWRCPESNIVAPLPSRAHGVAHDSARRSSSLPWCPRVFPPLVGAARFASSFV